MSLLESLRLQLKTTDEIYRLVDNNQNSVAPGTPLQNSEQVEMMTVATEANADFKDTANMKYFSGSNYSALRVGTNGLKKSVL